MKKLLIPLAVALMATSFPPPGRVADVPPAAATSDAWAAQTALTAAEKQAIVAAHNNARRSVVGNTGAPLPAMVWNDTIAAFAQKWANTLAGRCNGSQDHNPARTAAGYGENIFSAWTSNMTAPPTPATTAIGYWVGEKQYYAYSKTKCAPGSVCGTCSKLPCVHYTQIVWRATTRVGCARATCKVTGKNYTIWVCDYSPVGNIVGQPPY